MISDRHFTELRDTVRYRAASLGILEVIEYT